MLALRREAEQVRNNAICAWALVASGHEVILDGQSTKDWCDVRACTHGGLMDEGSLSSPVILVALRYA